MKKYRDLFIDFDDTLYDTRGNAILALEELYYEMGFGEFFEKPEDFYMPYWDANVELWSKYAKGEITRDYLIVERFRRPLSRGKGLEDVGKEFCLKVSDRFLELCACKEGVVDGAHELVEYLRRKGYRLSICSNGFHEVQYKKLRACGLFDMFDHIILSEDAGANKPSRVFFDYALEKTGAKVEDTLMIGDNFNTDILGAMSVGMDTMLFNRWDSRFVPPVPCTFVVNSLKEIMSVL